MQGAFDFGKLGPIRPLTIHTLTSCYRRLTNCDHKVDYSTRRKTWASNWFWGVGSGHDGASGSVASAM